MEAPPRYVRFRLYCERKCGRYHYAMLSEGWGQSGIAFSRLGIIDLRNQCWHCPKCSRKYAKQMRKNKQAFLRDNPTHPDNK